MNSKIRELAEQALFESDFDDEQNIKITMDIFAELIVKECMDCSIWVGNVNSNPVEPIHTAHAINKRIKKHFGFEE